MTNSAVREMFDRWKDGYGFNDDDDADVELKERVEAELDSVRFPKLTDKMIKSACKAHFGSDIVDGINVTAHDIDWSFREAFERMWVGARKGAGR